MNIHRAALHYAPAPGTPWHVFGSAWLGRDAVSGVALVQPALPATDLHALTSEPRRYGFHATLKAPFRLATPHSLESLKQALERFTRAHAPVPLGTLTADWMEGFVALQPSAAAHPAISALAGEVVEAFDHFRAPLTQAETERRLAHPLSPRQEELLARYGYPYVHEEFRFHMTLSNAVDAEHAGLLITAASAQLTGLGAQVPRLDAITLFVEPAPGVPFIAVRRYPLLGEGNRQ